MKAPTVWVVKEQLVRNSIGSEVIDYTPAAPYGDIRFITVNDIPLHQNSGITSRWFTDVATFAVEYDTSRDFIIATGQPTAIFAVGHALGLMQKNPRFLVWRREENRYRVLDVYQ
ncbi:hypothetical protein UFOVP580_48 [uncultured Caudovirales phage]|uniref:Uncharacterized protein n=1 Tax=uncultured Caudovirales phage TaxID=2100421 RepID=A0A6J5PI04_9CAUD|nr:hypothetical protein UFOVP580_48 [uncultured Caudovirales phage]